MSGEKTDMGLLHLLHLRMSNGICDILGDISFRQVRPGLGRHLGWALTQADVHVCIMPNVAPERSRPPDWPRRWIHKWSQPRCFLPHWLCSWFQIHSRYMRLHDGVIWSEGHRLSSRGGQDEGLSPCNRSRRNDKVREEPLGWCGRCVFVQPVAIWEL